MFSPANQRASLNLLQIGYCTPWHRAERSHIVRTSPFKDGTPRSKTAKDYFEGRWNVVQDSAPQSRMNIGANSPCLTQMISKRNLILTSGGTPWRNKPNETIALYVPYVQATCGVQDQALWWRRGYRNGPGWIYISCDLTELPPGVCPDTKLSCSVAL